MYPDSIISLADKRVHSRGALSQLRISEARTESAYWQTRTTCAFARQIGFGSVELINSAGRNVRTDVGLTLDTCFSHTLRGSFQAQEFLVASEVKDAGAVWYRN